MQQAIEEKTRCPGCKKKFCDGCGIYKKLNTNKQIPVHFPKDFIPVKQSGLGLSIDLGTTTVAGMLWNLEDGTLLAVEAANNPQSMAGADIISRIQYAMTEKETEKPRLQELIVKCLDQMADRMSGAENIQKVVVAGNTAMCELLLGILPIGIASAPFQADYRQSYKINGEQLGFQMLKNAEITVLPPIGGYVGSDALAVYHAVHREKMEGIVLMMDIGTNGELLLQTGGKCFACSVAAGPALEGGFISAGMRAAEGAIDRVTLQGNFPIQDLLCSTVNHVTPKGICGSGLIDTITILCKLNVIDTTGYLCNREEAVKRGVPQKICHRIETLLPEEINRILLTDTEHPVYLTAGDIRQLQLAIAAIRTGTQILLGKAQIQTNQIDHLYIAGAFGSFIPISSGIALGLFPKILEEKIIQAGNLASTGAAMALLSPTDQERMQEEARQIIHIDLANEENFTSLLLDNMKIPI